MIIYYVHTIIRVKYYGHKLGGRYSFDNNILELPCILNYGQKTWDLYDQNLEHEQLFMVYKLNRLDLNNSGCHVTNKVYRTMSG